jgi:hypothetical protein
MERMFHKKICKGVFVMENKKFLLGILVMVLVFGSMLTGCQMEDSGPTYTVYISRGKASDEPDLQDGYYQTLPLTDAQFKSQVGSAFYQNANKNNWTESEIYACLIGMNFSEKTANELKKRIVSNKHIEIGFRKGGYIDWLLK